MNFGDVEIRLSKIDCQLLELLFFNEIYNISLTSDEPSIHTDRSS